MTKRIGPSLGYFVACVLAGCYLGYIAPRGMDTRLAMAMPLILLTVLAFAWCRKDAVEQNRRFPLWVKLLVVLAAPFGFAVYVFTTHAWSGAIRTSLLGFAVATLGGVLFIGSIAVTDSFRI